MHLHYCNKSYAKKLLRVKSNKSFVQGSSLNIHDEQTGPGSQRSV